ncbi:MAG: hypothetical protein WB795_02360 [Candidatus Acidiferrales bacterium]
MSRWTFCPPTCGLGGNASGICGRARPRNQQAADRHPWQRRDGAGHRERLPAAAAKRLDIVVDLAVRLRETIRRLSVTRDIQVPDAIRSA